MTWCVVCFMMFVCWSFPDLACPGYRVHGQFRSVLRFSNENHFESKSLHSTSSLNTSLVNSNLHPTHHHTVLIIVTHVETCVHAYLHIPYIHAIKLATTHSSGAMCRCRSVLTCSCWYICSPRAPWRENRIQLLQQLCSFPHSSTPSTGGNWSHTGGSPPDHPKNCSSVLHGNRSPCQPAVRAPCRRSGAHSLPPHRPPGWHHETNLQPNHVRNPGDVGGRESGCQQGQRVPKLLAAHGGLRDWTHPLFPAALGRGVHCS